MAEIMLLLVFCLLIAMATFILKEQKKSQAAENRVKELLADNKRNEDLVQALSKNSTLVEKLKAVAGSSDPQAIDQYWRELVEGRATADELKKSGMSLTELRQRIEQIKTLDANGIKVDKAIQDANAVAAINRVLAKPGEPQCRHNLSSRLLVGRPRTAARLAINGRRSSASAKQTATFSRAAAPNFLRHFAKAC
ncbi:hypothetical protein BLN97_16200 [Bradyrhizobium elkanii]|nr:hypothetical protein BLN97_16200 [Bradyrhizobium elkanii]